MKSWKLCAAGLVALASWTPSLLAQQPAPPAVPAVPGPPAPGGLWTFLGLSKPQLAECRDKICKSQFGQLMNNSMAPIRTFTGGIMPSCCPVASRADLAKPADSAEGAAARIKADEAAAKARRAATRYLGTVDCHYWPEAEAALINTLRTDKNECVRMEAAWALGSGCCCTKKTVEALAITVSGSDRDGNPAERSERVKEAARFALERCVACFNSKCAMGDQLPPPKEQAPKEGGATTEKPRKDGVPYYEKIMTQPAEDIYDRARKLLEGGYTPEGLPTADLGDRSLTGVIRSAFNKNPAPAGVPAASVALAMSKPRNTVIMHPVAAQPVHPVQQQPVAVQPVQQPPRGLVEVARSSMNRGSEQPVRTEAVMKPETPRPLPPAAKVEAPKPLPAAAPRPMAEVKLEAPRADNKLEVVDRPLPLTPAVVVSSERGVDRPNQMPELATAYRTVTYSKPAQSTMANELPAGVFLPQLLEKLEKGSTHEREWAATHLNRVDCRAHPEVILALTHACQADTSAAVRASCVRSLADLKVDSPEVMNALYTLQADASEDVRVEAHRALNKLKK